MAKIVLSDLAPKGPVTFSVLGVTFELDGSKKTSSFETDDRAVIENAGVNPWLTIAADAKTVEVPDYSQQHKSQVRPEDDAFSATGPGANVPFDPAEVAKVEEAKIADAQGSLVAIDAGLDQKSAATTATTPAIAQTIAAADAANTGEES